MDTSTDENLMKKIACESNLLWSQWTKKLGKNLTFYKGEQSEPKLFPGDTHC